MSDYYTEQMVKKQTTMKDIAFKALLVALTIVSVLSMFMFVFGIFLVIAMGVIDVLVLPRLKVEYEYLYVNGDLDIDKIMNKAKRKNLFSASVSDMELLAPVDAPELHPYQNLKTLKYVSGTNPSGEYAMVVKSKGEMKKIIFEPNDAILEGFYMMAPRKVIRRKMLR